MGDMSIIKAGIVWAMPVKPDLLGRQIEAYAAALPALNSLRLCHRFGHGPNVNITKLPAEIMLIIEDEVFAHHCQGTGWGEWEEAFQHYESRCAPIDHLFDDRPLDFMDDMRDENSDELCESCKEVTTFYLECKGCHDLIERRANECLCDSSDWRYQMCEEERAGWLKMIDQRPGGKFEKYDQLLLKQFGLKASFSNSRIRLAESAAWTKNKNYEWHSEDELETTICFLVVPTTMARKKTYGMSAMEADCGPSALVPGTQSSFVVVPDGHDQGKRVKQFGRIIRTLNINPYVYPSQLDDTVSASPIQLSLQPKNTSEEHTEKSGPYNTQF